uniref:Uncharacterized protein n=1 Tax=Nymphaea colorata TaxID=210225 RepID=A0A5K0ZN39_9MAGN
MCQTSSHSSFELRISFYGRHKSWHWLKVKIFKGLTGEVAAPLELIDDSSSSYSQKLVPNPQFTSWRKTDHLIKGWITSTLTESALGLVVGFETSKDISRALMNAFSRKSCERISSHTFGYFA